jgi:hypothetical protein
MYDRHNIGYIILLCVEWECFSCFIPYNNIPVVVLLAIGVSWQSVQGQDSNAKKVIQYGYVQRPNLFLVLLIGLPL